jgi:hypothetical protein
MRLRAKLMAYKQRANPSLLQAKWHHLAYKSKLKVTTITILVDADTAG